jgi:hypothetical protein
VLTTLNVRTQERESIVVTKEKIPTFGSEKLVYFAGVEKEPVEIRVVSFAAFWSNLKQNLGLFQCFLR